MILKNFLPNKKRGEHVIFHLRRHWFVFVKLFLFFIFLICVPVGIYYFLLNNFQNFLTGDIGAPILTVLGLAYYLIILVFLFTIWTETYLDIWTVTTDRIINREQNGLFNRVVSEMDLYRIQDVTAEQKGFFSTLFHYGDVYIQSAGSKERFVLEQIPRPYKVAKIIQRLDEKAKKSRPMR